MDQSLLKFRPSRIRSEPGRREDTARSARGRRVIRAPPSLVDEEEHLEEVPPLKRTRGDTTSVSVAIVRGSSQVPDTIP